jgi:cytidine deaminase
MSKKITITAEIVELTWDELSLEDQNLIIRAKAISEDAYAPYSDFHVGAAVQLNSGEILQSSNQENVSFPVGVCAERSLLGFVGANYSNDPVKKLAIAARRKGEEAWASVSACGLCRQTISETEMRFNQSITLLILKPNGNVLRIPGIQALLPFKFDDLNG